MDKKFNVENSGLQINLYDHKVLKIDKTSIFNCKVESCEEVETSIFREQYRKAAKSFLDIISVSKIYNEVDNIVAFIGEKGSGKTTVLRSFIKSLKDNEYILLKGHENVSEINFEVLNVIDLSYKKDKNSVISTILFALYRSFLKKNNVGNHTWKQELEDIFSRIFKQIKDISITGTSIFELNDYFIIKESISEIIRIYLNYCKKDYLVIPIDNISSLESAKEVIDDLKMYFNCEKIIIMLTIDRELIDEGKINIDDVGVYSNMIDIEPLKLLSEKLDIDREDFKNIPVSTGDNIYEQIRDILVKKFNYCIYTLDAFKILVGENVGNIIKLIGFINSLSGEVEKDEYSIEKYFEALAKRIHLGGKQYKILKSIFNTDIRELNKYTFISVNELIMQKRDIYEEAEKSEEFYSYVSNNRFKIKKERVSIGDVITCIEVFRAYKTREYDLNFIELLKAAYTIRLLMEYNKDTKRLIESVGEDYSGYYFKMLHSINQFDSLIEVGGKKSAEDLKAFFGYRKELFISILEPCYDYNNDFSKYIYNAVNIFKEEDIYKQKHYKFKFLNILSYSLLNRQDNENKSDFILNIINIDYWISVLETLADKLKKANVEEDRYFIDTIRYIKEILDKNNLFKIEESHNEDEEITAKGIEGDFIVVDDDVEFLQNLNNELIKAQYLYSYNV